EQSEAEGRPLEHGYAAAAFISDRAFEIAARYWRARSSITSKRPAVTDLLSTSSPPTPQAQDPAFRKSPIVSRFTPPVGTISICGSSTVPAPSTSLLPY